MKDFGALMKQARGPCREVAASQAELEQLVLRASRRGMVKVTLKGTGQILRVDIDESLMVPARPRWSAIWWPPPTPTPSASSTSARPS
jgi:DNA-binding protein YbaB